MHLYSEKWQKDIVNGNRNACTETVKTYRLCMKSTCETHFQLLLYFLSLSVLCKKCVENKYELFLITNVCGLTDRRMHVQFLGR